MAARRRVRRVDLPRDREGMNIYFFCEKCRGSHLPTLDLRKCSYCNAYNQRMCEFLVAKRQDFKQPPALGVDEA
jgi:hypothetical protein